MATALNQTGQQSLEVTGEPVQITLPTYTDYTDAPNGIERSQTPRHALIQVYDNPVRWASYGEHPTGFSGQLIQPGDTLDFTDPRRDFYGILANMELVLDVSATGNANVEIDYFA